MGLSQIKWVDHLRRISSASRGLAIIAVFGLLAGCETKSWFDPSELGRYEHKPLLVPILKNLDTGFEESDEQYANAVEARPEDMVASAGDYVVGRNDLVQVSIGDLIAPGAETIKVSRVSESGYISLPMIGQIKAAGLTEAQLEVAIIQAFRDKQLLANAQVSVVTVEARNRIFTIYGAIARAGQYQILQSDFRLLDAMVIAGDATSQVGIEYVYVIRKLEAEQAPGAAGDQPPILFPAPTSQPGPDILAPRTELPVAPKFLQTAGQAQPRAADGTIVTIEGRQMEWRNGQLVPVEQPNATPGAQAPMAQPPTSGPGDKGFEFNALKEPGDVRIIRVPFSKLKDGELKYNVVIRPQDFIVVPQPVIGEYYVGGHIARTGVYSLSARDVTLRSAIISAGGLDALAIPERTEIVRKVGRFKKVYSRVNLARIFSGEDPDILLKPDDEVMVGTNAPATFLAAFRAAFRITYGFGFLYDRQFAGRQGGVDF